MKTIFNLIKLLTHNNKSGLICLFWNWGEHFTIFCCKFAVLYTKQILSLQDGINSFKDHIYIYVQVDKAIYNGIICSLYHTCMSKNIKAKYDKDTFFIQCLKLVQNDNT